MGKPCYGSPMIRSRTIRMAAALLPAIFTASCATTQGNSVAETETVAAYLARIAPKAGADAFRSTFSDLNGDGTFEAIIYLSAPGNCGSSGCSLLILTPEDGRYREVTRMSVSRLPVRQLGSMTNGWHDLGVTIGGGGAAPAEAWMRFDGNAYPRNPTTQPVVPDSAEAVVLLAPQS